MNYKLYLERINATQPLVPGAETLARLQYLHLLHVPFENLDIWYRRPFVLDAGAMYRKIVTEQRGGYCYECNGLFYELLSWLGFRVRMISCRVTNGRHTGPAFDHMALLVTVDGEDWLVDAGFGDFSIVPLRIRPGMMQTDGRDHFLISAYGEIDGAPHYSVSRMKAGRTKFTTVYLFSTAGHLLQDFEGMNAWHQSSAQSHFTRQLICSRLTEGGRISLVGNRLIVTNGQDKEEKLLYGNDACYDLLVNEMGMTGSYIAPLLSGENACRVDE